MPDRTGLPPQLTALSRMFHAAVDRYIELGKVGGNLRMPNLSEEERLALTGILGDYVSTRAGETLVLPLAALEQALRQRNVAAGIPELAATLEGHAVQTRAVLRGAESLRWETFLASLAARAEAVGGRSGLWLGALAQREGSAAPVVLRQFNQEERGGGCGRGGLQHDLDSVARALDRLPADSGVTARLPIFAREVTGDPHEFDENTLAGRLLIRALTDAFGASCGVPSVPEGSLERSILLSEAGLLTDGISSSVACYGFDAALRADGAADSQVAGAAVDGAVFLGSLRQVSAWVQIDFVGDVVFAVENPPVFEDLVDALIADHRRCPVLCVSGFPSVAATRVLSLVVAQGARIAYGGDFDLKGLTIAAGLARRYGGHFSLWGMEPADYLEAAHHPHAKRLSEKDLAGLEAFAETPLAALATAMKRKKVRAYQEALIAKLKASIA